MIDLSQERGLSPSEAAQLLPSFRAGRPCHASRIIRLIVKGVAIPDGSRISLEALKIANQWITTSRCITEFGQRLAAAQLQARDDTPQPRPTKARTRAAERADRELDRIGI